jgi:hypothetical protein
MTDLGQLLALHSQLLTDLNQLLAMLLQRLLYLLKALVDLDKLSTEVYGREVWHQFKLFGGSSWKFSQAISRNIRLSVAESFVQSLVL